VLRIHVDGETEEHQLQQRDADHHAESDAVPRIWMNSFTTMAQNRRKLKLCAAMEESFKSLNR